MKAATAALAAAATLAAAVAVPLALVVAPREAVQGDAQRLMYVHVPAAWSGYLCFVLVALASLAYLVRGGERAWALGRAAAQVGVGLTALTLATGTIWGALTWGTWWAWDARIMTTAAMGLVYVGYLAVAALANSSRSARCAAALVGVAGVVMVPVVHLSVFWWRTLHQPPTILAPGTGLPIDPTMGLALAAGLLTMTLWTAVLVLVRMRIVLGEQGARSRPRSPAPGSRSESGGAAVGVASR